ncbi:hypothetical protein KP509_03G031600 [Ceratopteris richardii]|uniref:Protein kinase domain-containing protein n=1 Tax=Ceratopteris richardii TaxID=49495 RepID=A0A8T2VA81_CERRI|nr:hypothetical protein KP509_03G031600 [Ceratopteris richardii]
MQQTNVIDIPLPEWYGTEGFQVPAPEPNGIHGVFIHGGRLLQYNVYGHIFEVTAKYRPPIKPISRGAYGVVCSAYDVEANEEVAIKKITNAFDNVVVARRTLREIKILGHMDHENILGLRDVILPPAREDYKDVYFVTELLDADLHHIIKTNRDVTEEHYQYFLYQLLRGLKYIHSANVLHRDLKPNNLLVTEDCDLKIADFGLARTFSESDLMTEYVVTRWYRSPELLLNARGYTAAVDMWSVGCILMELFNKVPLFPGKDYVHQFSSITEVLGSPTDAELAYVRSENAIRYLNQLPWYPREPLAAKFLHVPPLAIDLIERMLKYNPAERITAEEALAHPYLASLHDEADEPVCPRPFDFNVDEQSLSEDDIREEIYQEALMYNRRYHQ